MVKCWASVADGGPILNQLGGHFISAGDEVGFRAHASHNQDRQGPLRRVGDETFIKPY